MARKIDESKMERVAEAAISLIVEKGYGQASISSIAKKAKVAEGYLYRFYSSKEEMVNAFLFKQIGELTSKIDELLENFTSVNKIIEEMVSSMFSIADANPVNIKFLYVLMHDYNFQVDEEQRNTIKTLLHKILVKGREQKEIGNLVREEEMYNTVIMYPIVFLNLRLKNFFGNTGWTDQDKSVVSKFCIQSLQTTL